MRSPRLIGRAFLVIFCLWHMLAISLIQLPLSTAFGDLHHRTFNRYNAFTGTWQRWGMFSSRPYIQTVRVTLKAYPAEPASAPPVEVDPVLPGFQPIGRDLRLEYLFLMGVTGQSPFLDDYLKRTCRKFQEHFGWQPASMAVQVRYGYTRAFATADPSGRTLENLDLEYKRAACV